MTDPIVNDVKADAAKVETSATGWVKAHLAWAIGAGCFVLGFILGHLL